MANHSRNAEENPGNAPLILIVDDNPDQLSTISNNLKNEGFRLAQAISGAEALEAVTRRAPDLILVDVMLPDMDGIETCQRLRALPGGDVVPILLMTELDDETAVERAFQAGATDFVAKPIRWTVLNARIQSLLKSCCAERRYQALAQAAADGIITIDNQGLIQYLNSATEVLFGYQAAEIVGQDISILMPDEFGKAHSAGIQRYLETRQPKVIGGTVELQGLRKNGEVFRMELSLSVSEFAGELSFTGIIRDISERFQAQVELEHSHQFLRTVLESLSHPFYVINAADYTIQLANAAANQATITESTTCYALTHQNDQPCRSAEHPCPLEEVKRTKKAAQVEHIHFDASGEPRNVEVHAHPIFDSQGNVTQVIEYTLDVTERVQLEREIAESRTYLENVLSSAPNAIVTADNQHTIRSWNPGAQRLFGYAAEEAIGQKIDDLITGKDSKIIDEADKLTRQVLAGSRISDIETIRYRKDGSPVHVIASGNPIFEEDALAGVAVVYTDISERVQAELASRESQARYAHIFQNAGVAIWVEDFSAVKSAIEEVKAQGIEDFSAYLDEYPEFITQAAQLIQIIDVNQITLDLFGAEDKAELLGALDIIFVPQTGKIIRDELLAIANGLRYFEGETVNRTLGGEPINILMTIVFPEEEDRFDEVLVSMMDITERVRLAKETQTRAALMAQLASLSEQLNRPFIETQVIESIGQGGMLLCGVERGAVYLRTPENEVACPWFQNLSPEYIEKMVSQFRDMPGGQLLNQTAPVLIPDINALPEDLLVAQLARMEGYQGVGLWPLIYEDQVIAAFASYHDHPHTWTPAEQEVLLAFTRQAAVALENTRLIHQEQQRRQELARLYRASESLQSSTKPDLATLAQSIVDTVLREFDQTNCSLILVKPDQNELQRVAVSGPYADQVINGQLFLDGLGLVPKAIQTGQIINEPEVYTKPDYLPNWADACSEIAIPLKIGDRVIGVIDVQSAEKNAFSSDDERLLSAFAERAALALVNAQLFAETQQQTLEMATLNDQLQVLNITLEERVRQRTYEMQVLHELSQEISYTLDYEELFRRMLSHLHRIVNYDVAVCLLVLDKHPIYYQRIARPLLSNIQEDVQAQLTSTFERMSETQAIDWDTITIQELELLEAHQTEKANGANAPVEALNSTFQVPLIERASKQMIGMLFIGAERKNAFSEASVRMLYTLASQASVLLERLRSLMDVEQQRLESLVERIPEGVILLDKSRKVILENPLGQRFLAKLTNVGPGQVLSDLGGQEMDSLLQPRQDGIPHEIALRTPEHQVFEVESRQIETGPEAGGWALAIRDVTWERDLLAAEKTRRRELDALYHLSRELTATDNFDDVLQTISKHAVESIHISFSRIILQEDEQGFRCRAAYPVRSYDKSLGIGDFDPEITWPIYQKVLSEKEPLLLNTSDDDYPPEVLESFRYHDAQLLCMVPLKIGDEALGVLVLGESRDSEREPFNDNKIRLASAIGDQSASAIHRAGLQRKTEQNLRRLMALRQIDMAITSSVDLHMTLSILLEQITTQLDVDAANVLLLNPYLQNLEHAKGSGFRTKGIENLVVRLGEGYAGRAALNRELIQAPDMLAELPHADYAKAIVGEDFRAYYGVPLKAKGKIIGVLEIYHRSPLRRDRDWLDFLETLAGQTAIAIDSAEMFTDLQRSNMELRMAYDATIEGWASALEYRDMETEGHSRRVVDLTTIIARKMGIRQDELLHIRRGALLHDIGKMGIPDRILHKKGPLSDEEWKLMRQHPVFAYEMLDKIDFLHKSLDIPHYHHERWDGTGYPKGFKGRQIPLSARIFAIVDVWDALSSDRPYREAWPKEKIIAHLQEESGKHFDPQVVDAFLEIVAESDS
jgi:PAS domain S-box-containing protein